MLERPAVRDGALLASPVDGKASSLTATVLGQGHQRSASKTPSPQVSFSCFLARMSGLSAAGVKGMLATAQAVAKAAMASNFLHSAAEEEYAAGFLMNIVTDGGLRVLPLFSIMEEMNAQHPSFYGWTDNALHKVMLVSVRVDPS